MNRLDGEEGRQGPLSSYLSRIDRYALLTPDEEKSLAMRWRHFRDPEAADRLVTGQLDSGSLRVVTEPFELPLAAPPPAGRERAVGARRVAMRAPAAVRL